MKRVALVTACALVLGLAGVPALAHGDHGKHEHDVTVAFVSCDAKAMTMTFTTTDGEQKTAPMQKNVASTCSNMKSGDKVTLTCLDNEKGEHQTISNIKPAMAAKEKPAH